MTQTNTTTFLYNYSTGERVGVATDEQIKASAAAGETGAIMIDSRTGQVLTAGSWDVIDAGCAGSLQTVYTA
jgi:hypothetical protein